MARAANDYRTWPMIQEQIKAARPPKLASQAWVIKECRSLPARTRNALAKLDVLYSGDLEYVTAAELRRQGGLGTGAVNGIKSICGSWGVVLGSKAAPAVAWAAAVESAMGGGSSNAAEAVNHPAHYKPGPFEVCKVLRHFQVLNPNLWNAIKYLARAHSKGRESEDRAKAAWYLKDLLESEFGYNQPATGQLIMSSKTIEQIAVEFWGCTLETAAIIGTIAKPYTDMLVDTDGAVPNIGEYASSFFTAWCLLTGND